MQAGGLPSPKEWVELDQVRAALPADAMLIDIARFGVANFAAKGDEKQYHPARYAAWLIPAKVQGEVQLIDLGEAEKIDAAVAALRKELRLCQNPNKEVNPILRLGEPEAEKQVRPVLEAVAKLVLQPLRKHLDAKKQWIVSPNGALWLVPWAALPLDADNYAIEKHTIDYVVSGRDLVMPPSKASGKRDEPLLVADPDFDLDPREVGRFAAKLLGQTRPPVDAVAQANISNGNLAARPR